MLEIVAKRALLRPVDPVQQTSSSSSPPLIDEPDLVDVSQQCLRRHTGLVIAFLQFIIIYACVVIYANKQSQ